MDRQRERSWLSVQSKKVVTGDHGQGEEEREEKSL